MINKDKVRKSLKKITIEIGKIGKELSTKGELSNFDAGELREPIYLEALREVMLLDSMTLVAKEIELAIMLLYKDSDEFKKECEREGKEVRDVVIQILTGGLSRDERVEQEVN